MKAKCNSLSESVSTCILHTGQIKSQVRLWFASEARKFLWVKEIKRKWCYLSLAGEEQVKWHQFILRQARKEAKEGMKWHEQEL